MPTLAPIQINDVRLIDIPAININPDGTRDLTKSHWKFGGIVYIADCTDHLGNFEIQIQREYLNDGTSTFYAAEYDIQSTSLMPLIKQARGYDLAIYSDELLKPFRKLPTNKVATGYTSSGLAL